MTAHHYLENIVADLEKSSIAQRKTADEFEQRALEFRKKADDDALDADELRALLDYTRLPDCEAANRTSAENMTEKSNTEHQHASHAENRSNDGEAMRVAGNRADDTAHGIKMQGLLHLTVPHLTNAVQDHAEAHQKGILVAHCDRRDGYGNASNEKRNGPLAVIANFLGIHRRSPVAEIRIRLHLSEDGGLTQEVILPRNWRFVPYQPS
jgi:hypothetical protein